MDNAVEDVVEAFKAAYYKYKDFNNHNSDQARTEINSLRNNTLDELVKATDEMHKLIKKNCADGSSPGQWPLVYRAPYSKFSRYVKFEQGRAALHDSWLL